MKINQSAWRLARKRMITPLVLEKGGGGTEAGGMLHLPSGRGETRGIRPLIHRENVASVQYIPALISKK
jgi:hypothetical protein